ncbi:glycine zipper 2TM domain-containing protein [Pseudomonas sp. LPB0260]|uniref:glycine zipper domain-containing protein n=1 Tax=Pseudomonas sp. LPB0260 TaxID=2614442 RepID=UPI0015C27494|nr:glycine zipper domain-containing protein [Pseudomonas sp. LPB0260]QLC72357.1 glycine zipper 2TM domain-containing protein [Pseudomonas sp. LPB0260]QLC75133.1 glycine zipper 2TM domain-containing protein [Pseudomonas sp. LPB0260]
MTTRYLCLVLMCTLLVACSSTGNKQNIGVLIGGGLGALTGAKLSKDSNRAASIAIGTAVGALVGYGIGRYLDDQDQQRMATATVQTAESGRPQEVRNPDTGTTIRTTPVANAPTSTPTTASNCRTVRQSVELPDGRNESEDVTVCKGPNGWEAV